MHVLVLPILITLSFGSLSLKYRTTIPSFSSFLRNICLYIIHSYQLFHFPCLLLKSQLRKKSFQSKKWSLMMTLFRLCILINGLNLGKVALSLQLRKLDISFMLSSSVLFSSRIRFSFTVLLDFFADTTESRISLLCLEFLCFGGVSCLNDTQPLPTKSVLPATNVHSHILCKTYFHRKI